MKVKPEDIKLDLRKGVAAQYTIIIGDGAGYLYLDNYSGKGYLYFGVGSGFEIDPNKKFHEPSEALEYAAEKIAKWINRILI